MFSLLECRFDLQLISTAAKWDILLFVVSFMYKPNQFDCEKEYD